MARLRRVNARLQQEDHVKDNALQQYKVTTELTLTGTCLCYESLFSFLKPDNVSFFFCKLYMLVLYPQELYRDLGKEVPKNALQRLSAAKQL